MKRFFGSKEFSSYTARSTSAFILAALAVLLVGCGGGGGGGDSAPSSQNTTTIGIADIACSVFTLLAGGGSVAPSECINIEVPTVPVESCDLGCPIEGSATSYSKVFDVEPNDSISTASVASFPHAPELLVAFYVEGSINNLTDSVDAYAFTATRSRTFVFQLCGGTFANNGCEDGILDVAIAYFNVLDQYGIVLLSSEGNSVNFQQMRIDAGVLYYVMVIAKDTVNEDQAYILKVREALIQPELEVLQEPDPNAPILSAGEATFLTTTLDWMPPTMNVDGTPLLDLAGYNVYFGPKSGMYLDFRHLDNPGLATYVLDLPSSGSWFIVITAIDSTGDESDFSNEASVSVMCECDLPPGDPELMP